MGVAAHLGLGPTAWPLILAGRCTELQWVALHLQGFEGVARQVADGHLHSQHRCMHGASMHGWHAGQDPEVTRDSVSTSDYGPLLPLLTVIMHVYVQASG